MRPAPRSNTLTPTLAFSQRSTYSRTHFWSVWHATAFNARSQDTESKNAFTSISTTQLFSQHRFRHAATASSGDLPGR